MKTNTYEVDGLTIQGFIKKDFVLSVVRGAVWISISVMLAVSLITVLINYETSMVEYHNAHSFIPVHKNY